MPAINISDARNRDAVIKAESTRHRHVVRYVGPWGKTVYPQRLLKATVEQDYESLIEQYKDDDKLAEALVNEDPEIRIDRAGQFLWGMSRVYINPEDELVFRIEQQEIVRDPAGKVRSRRKRRRLDANVDTEFPLRWSGRLIPKSEAIRRYIFGTKLQLLHINGLTYDFLFDMAKTLHEADSLMIVGAGKKGSDPLVFRRGSTPYRGFLEGRIDGEKYILLLHLSNLEMKVPGKDQ